MTITIKGNAKIIMSGHDVTELIKDNDELVSIEGLRVSLVNCCEHESDGFGYYKSGVRYTDFLEMVADDKPVFSKCKKCGEFYT